MSADRMTHDVHACERCGRAIRATLRWCWRCPEPIPIGTWRVSGDVVHR